MDFFKFEDSKFKIVIENFRKRFNRELKYLNEYFELNNKMLNSRRNNLDLCLKEDIQKHPDQEYIFRDFYQIDYIKIPCYFYNSAIVSLYSLLENNINHLCEIIELESNLGIKLRDLAGSNIIDKGRLFLIKIGCINFEKIDKEWSRITDFQKLRNLIVHNNAQMKNPERDIKLMSKFKEVRTYNINIENDFHITDISIVYEFLGLIENFIVSILNQIEDREFKKYEFDSNSLQYNTHDDLPF